MKKIVVLVAVLTLMAGSAFGLTIVNSKHDLSSGSTTTGPKVSGVGSTDQVCVFCHTPHSAAAAGFAPLWNRTTVEATAVYTGVDIQATITLAGVNSSDAPLCLSCHDGASLTDALVNPPNRATAPLNNLANITNANANLGTDLRDDHPVGFNYDGAAALDAEIDTRAQAISEVSGINFYGANTNIMWCSSCHDVHDNTYGAFLLTINSASKLCLACHIK